MGANNTNLYKTLQDTTQFVMKLHTCLHWDVWRTCHTDVNTQKVMHALINFKRRLLKEEDWVL